MFSTVRSSGFTLIELLVVIAIIGVLATVVIATTGESRERSRNATVLSQMDQYSKALELYYAHNRRYPNGNSSPSTFPHRAYCIGDDWNGTGLCLPGGGTGVPVLQSGNIINSDIETELPAFMSALPNFVVSKNGTTYTSPAYSACNETGDTGPAALRKACRVNSIGPQEYSLWFVLEGANQSCGRGQSINPSNHAANEITLCRYGPPN